MYVCGPTVYDFVHIGNARAFVVADIVCRYLEYKGYKVRFVSNITDVDDKSIRRVQETGISLQQLGETYGDAYSEDMARLNVKKPDINPPATQHIDEIIELIQRLIDRGYAHEVGGDIYYDVSKFEKYGKLSGNKAEALNLGARIKVNPQKRNPPGMEVKEFLASNCKYADICPNKSEKCQKERPGVFEVGKVKVACWLYE